MSVEKRYLTEPSPVGVFAWVFLQHCREFRQKINGKTAKLTPIVRICGAT